MVLAETVCLISQVLGGERHENVCVREIMGLSPLASALCWHTAGHPTKLSQPPPSALSTSGTIQSPNRMPDTLGKGILRKRVKTLKKNISVNGEDEGGSYDGAHFTQAPSGAW